MRKLLIGALFINAALLFAIWQQLSVVAEVGGGGLDSPCETDQTKYSLDTNDDGAIDLSDFVFGLSWFFSGTEAPRVCLATDDLEARVAALEGKTTVSDLSCADGEIAKWDAAGSAWVCAEDLVEPPPPEVPGFASIGTNVTTGLHEYTHDQTGICFVLLEGGTFQMGSPASEPNRSSNEGPVHSVALDSFLIAKYEVTQAEYEAVMTASTSGLDPTPSFATGDDLPVERVSFDDLHLVDGFLERTGLSLPSEAQWEYAARGGTPTAFSFGDGCNANTCDLCATAAGFMWWCANAAGTTHDVGTKGPNPLGLHDMHGNVFEWCEDVFDGAFYDKLEAAGPNPVATSGSTNRVIRGGSFSFTATRCRSANRDSSFPINRNDFIGFRPARPSP